MTADRRNLRTASLCAGVIVGMVTLTAASVPLYRLFCQVTGYGGTVQRADASPVAAGEREITVFFNSDVDPDLPWSFRPLQRSMDVRVGEQNLAFYEAVNRAGHPVVGNAVYNVTPFKVGGHFGKVQCFCFNEQQLAAGERVEMPVSFFVDPAMVSDAATQDVTEITLSYTFFINEEETRRAREAAVAAERPARDTLAAEERG